MENSGVDWCDHTHNIWHGCTKKGPGCVNCYAECTSERYGHPGLWGDDAPRRFLSDSYWHNPLRWNRKAEAAGKPALVFCGSMCDWLEIHPNEEIAEKQDAERQRLFELIDQTPCLIWLLLTKRLENWTKCVPERWLYEGMPPNVWLGATICTQEELDTIYPVVESIERMYHPAMTFLSLEPLLEPLCLEQGIYQVFSGTGGEYCPDIEPHSNPIWLIPGGESRQRGRCRKTKLAWLEYVIEYGFEHQFPVFVKQLGHLLAKELGCTGKGADPAEWPEHLRVQQYPFQIVRYMCPWKAVPDGSCTHGNNTTSGCHAGACPLVKGDTYV
jgi:protein gp37